MLFIQFKFIEQKIKIIIEKRLIQRFYLCAGSFSFLSFFFLPLTSFEKSILVLYRRVVLTGNVLIDIITINQLINHFKF